MGEVPVVDRVGDAVLTAWGITWRLSIFASVIAGFLSFVYWMVGAHPLRWISQVKAFLWRVADVSNNGLEALGLVLVVIGLCIAAFIGLWATSE